MLEGYVKIGSDAHPNWTSELKAQIRYDVEEPTAEAITAMNNKINKVFNYVPDIVDIWKSPDEFGMKGGGDCEDFCIYKFNTLLRLGVPQEDILLLLVHDTEKKQDHAVLMVRRIGGTTLLLDIYPSTHPEDYSNYIPLLGMNMTHTVSYLKNRIP